MSGEQRTPPPPIDRARYRTMTNMVWGLLVSLAVVFAVAALAWRPHHETVRVIDYTAQLADARRVAPYDVLAPAPMPSGWQATSARVGAEPGKPVTWHLGVLTADRRYVGLEQSSAPSVVGEKLGPVDDDGTTTVAGVVWQRKVLTERKGERAIVRSGDGVTTIVTGNVDYATLESFATTLH
jgi:hypothetical protein